MAFSLKINGKMHRVEVDDDTAAGGGMVLGLRLPKRPAEKRLAPLPKPSSPSADKQ
jgi:hypothetical protein